MACRRLLIFAVRMHCRGLTACGAGLIARRMEGIYKKKGVGARRKAIFAKFDVQLVQIVEMRRGSGGLLCRSFASVDLSFGTTRPKILAMILTTKSTAKTINSFKLSSNSGFYDVKRACRISLRGMFGSSRCYLLCKRCTSATSSTVGLSSS
jgi:hypothetical protein